MNPYERIAVEITDMLRDAYPDIEVRAEPWQDDRSRIAIYFVDPNFAVLYPWQRYHYLRHLIPDDYYEANLANTVWFELAPGESPEELEFPDEDFIKKITPNVMKTIEGSGFLEALDDAFCPRFPFKSRARCYGDFRVSKDLLLKHRFKQDEFSDVFHVLMSQGGYCDCEILFNVSETSRLKAEYWKARAKGLKPRDPHEAV